jgi:hypothetical protein
VVVARLISASGLALILKVDTRLINLTGEHLSRRLR